MKRKKTAKPYSRMTGDELAKATKEFERKFIADTFGPPDAAARRRHARAKGKRGRPVNGKGSKAISLTVERTLLQRTDRLAKKLKISRSQLVARGLRKVLQEEDS